MWLLLIPLEMSMLALASSRRRRLPVGDGVWGRHLGSGVIVVPSPKSEQWYSQADPETESPRQKRPWEHIILA